MAGRLLKACGKASPALAQTMVQWPKLRTAAAA